MVKEEPAELAGTGSTGGIYHYEPNILYSTYTDIELKLTIATRQRLRYGRRKYKYEYNILDCKCFAAKDEIGEYGNKSR
jgi:hypothetical protein